jgi:hypothetical protein
MKEKAQKVANSLALYDAYVAGFTDSHNATLRVFEQIEQTDQDKKQFEGVARQEAKKYVENQIQKSKIIVKKKEQQVKK